MIGGEVPDLKTARCPVCGLGIDAGEVVWDPYQRQDVRLAALPYHRACARDLLPPTEPAPELLTCAICGLRFPAEVAEEAIAQLHARFATAKAAVRTPTVVWRLAGRDPRRFVAEHFQCLLGQAVRKPPALPGAEGRDSPAG